jgi:putative SOS response-associated peptidase YedK
LRPALDGAGRFRCGLPSPPKFVTGVDRDATNFRNPASPHWRGWLKPENRCLVPATSFLRIHRHDAEGADLVRTWRGCP